VTDIAAIKTQLAAIEETIDGVQRAEAYAPRTINAADLPMFLNFTAQGQYAGIGPASDADLDTRTLLLRLYVKPAGSGIDGEAEAACEPFFARVKAAFADKPRLNRTCMVATLTGDGGVQILLYQGQPYIGIEFTMEVRA